MVGSVFGQDLGSSNKLFGGSKKKAPPTKKTADRPRVVVSKAKTPPKRPAVSTAKTKTPPKKKASAPTTLTAGKATAKKPVAVSTSTSLKKPDATPVKKVETPAKKVETSAKKFEIKTTPPPDRFRAVTPAEEELFEDLIEQGNVARDDRNYAAAEAAYNKAKPVKPRDSRAVYGLGNLYTDQQRWEEAEKAYRAALLTEPGFAITYVALSFVLTQPVIAPNLSERYEEAEILARKAIQFAPSNALAFDQLGVALELRGQIGAETENAYRTAIKLNPGFAPPYAHLGRLLRRRGLTKESEGLDKEAVERSTDTAIEVLVADVMQSEQRYAESEKLLRAALKEDPRNPSALLLLGRALTALGKFDDAENILKKSLTVSNNGFMGNSLLAALYLRRGNLEFAERTLAEARGFAGSFGKLRLSRQFEEVGDAYMKSSNRRFAERAYRQAIDLDSERESLVGKLSKARFG